jgi:hypothetical protein
VPEMELGMLVAAAEEAAHPKISIRKALRPGRSTASFESDAQCRARISEEAEANREAERVNGRAVLLTNRASVSRDGTEMPKPVTKRLRGRP